MGFQDLLASSLLQHWVFAALLLLGFLIQAYYYLFIFIRLITYKHPGQKGNTPPVSVVICARNEADNLSRNLPAFLLQDYPDYEVIVVNDCSTDHTEEVLMNLKTRFQNLRFTTIPQDRKFTHGKKLAVTVGIKSAANELLLFSDADCYPESDQWIRNLASHFSAGKELVLGVGKYQRRKGLMNLLVRYETLFTAMQYISFALKGYPYMGVGRNLAYKKELFFRHKGFASHLKVLSGDDDLFVNEAANSENTAVEFSAESFTISEAPKTPRAWFKQKKRHLSTGKYYKFSSKFRLGLEYFSRILFYATLIPMLFFGDWKWFALAGWFLLTLIRTVIIKLTMKRLSERDLLLPSLLLDPLMPLIIILIKISNIIRPREPKWN